MDTKEILERLSEIKQLHVELTVIQKAQTKLLEKHSEILESQKETLLRNTITVEEHHKRSLFLESKIDELEDEIEPLKAHLAGGTAIVGFIRLGTFILGGILSAFGIYNIIKVIF